MCISVFIWQAHPVYPFLLFLNRDEFHHRPTEALHWWEDGNILGGRDITAGGTWLASNRQGRVAFVTNVRQLNSLSAVFAKSRGDLPVRFLQSDKTPLEFAEEIVKEADQYNGFNLLIADLSSMNMVYVTNRPKCGSCCVTSVPPGIHVLSNASLDTPWPKAQRLEHGFRDSLNQYGDGELPVNEMVDKLMGNTVKDDLSKLPQIYSPEFEYQLSSVFVDTISVKGRYGTRSTSALAVKASGEVFFYEKHLENDVWIEHTETYLIGKNEKKMAGSSASVSLPKSAEKAILRDPESVGVGHLKPTDIGKVIHVKVYRKWTLTNFKDSKPVTFCFILLDQQGGAIQANVGMRDKDRFDNTLQINGTYRITGFGFQETKKWMQTLPNRMTLVFRSFTDVQTFPDIGFPKHHFNFAAYNELHSRADKNEAILTDYVGCIQNVGDVRDAGNLPKREWFGETLESKI